VIDPSSNELVGEVPVGRRPEAITTGLGGVWVTNIDDNSVSRVDPADIEARVANISVDDYPSDVTIGDGSVWVALGALSEVVRINPDSYDAAEPIPALGEDATPCGAPFATIAFGDGFVWFVCQVSGVGKIDARTGVAREIGYEGGLLTSSESVLSRFSDVAFGLGSLWIVDQAKNEVVEVDPLTNQSQDPLTVGQEPRAIAVGENALWVTNYDDDTVIRIAIPEPGQTPDLTTFPAGDGPVDIAVDGEAVWVVNQLDRTVMRLDPESGDVVATIGIGNDPQRIASGEGLVWVTVQAPAEEELESDATTP
jgi:streptogramin lyase